MVTDPVCTSFPSETHVGRFSETAVSTEASPYSLSPVYIDNDLTVKNTTFLTDKGITSNGSVSPKVVGIK